MRYPNCLNFFSSCQISITLIATGFKRQEEGEGRPLQVFTCLPWHTHTT